MDKNEKTSITIEAAINAPIEKIWRFWTVPEHVTKWNNASDDWHTPRAKNDLKPGGRFNYRMEAKDGSSGFDFGGVYDEVEKNKLITYTMDDGRKVKNTFISNGDETKVVVTFDAENTNPVEMQRTGWQAILNNFKKYAETNSVNLRMQPLFAIFDTHTRLFPNVIENISDKDAHNRLGTKANHVAWLTGSLVQQRVEIANLLGSDIKQDANELFKDYKGIQDNVIYPHLDSFKPDWEKVTPVLRGLLEVISDEKLDSIFEMEGMSMKYFDLIAFSIHREAYLIGQIGLWRRLLGYDAMKYM